mgnify:CR=1 FL=1
MENLSIDNLLEGLDADQKQTVIAALKAKKNSDQTTSAREDIMKRMKQANKPAAPLTDEEKKFYDDIINNMM